MKGRGCRVQGGGGGRKEGEGERQGGGRQGDGGREGGREDDGVTWVSL